MVSNITSSIYLIKSCSFFLCTRCIKWTDNGEFKLIHIWSVTLNKYIKVNETVQCDLHLIIYSSSFIRNMFRPISHLQKDISLPTWKGTTSQCCHWHVEHMCKTLFEVYSYALISKINSMLVLKYVDYSHFLKSFKIYVAWVHYLYDASQLCW
jgi:hypothetical protein